MRYITRYEEFADIIPDKNITNIRYIARFMSGGVQIQSDIYITRFEQFEDIILVKNITNIRYIARFLSGGVQIQSDIYHKV